MRGSILMVLIALTFLGSALPAQMLYQSHTENNVSFDIYNVTQNILVFNSTEMMEELDEQFYVNGTIPESEMSTYRISRVWYKFSDFLISSGFEFAKWSMEFGYNNPQYNFKFYMNMLILIVIIPLIIPIISIIYILYLITKKILDYIKRFKNEQERNKEEY